MSLPLLERARSGDPGYVFTPTAGKRARSSVALVQIDPQPLIPQRPLKPGEQYRFHFDMTKCIGCKCCVVACNEQNGNPAAINWRRVGEIEGGHFPYTQRYYLSMACNHCLEPSCLQGCPVEAYTKDSLTGIVLHSPDICIGCQYCTWNCSYGVPQYNPERGVVGKCDMCYHRLSDGKKPACVAACPQNAIAIEIVEVDNWRKDHREANAPGLPSADDSVSTTRITRPPDLLPDTGRVDTQRIAMEVPHWPLVFMLVLTQLSVGAFAALWLLDVTGSANSLLLSAVAALGVAGVSLGASTLHLGRPIFAWRAIRGWKRSWLSREVLGLSTFAIAAAAYAGLLMLDLPGRAGAGLLTAASGVLGVWCSARIYMVRARPAWSTACTPAEFFATVLFLGPLFVRALGAGDVRLLAHAAAMGAAAQLLTQVLKLMWLARAEQFELRASALLLCTRLRHSYLIRLALLGIAGIGMPLQVHSPAGMTATLLLALAGECMGRWLFFVSVVPKNIAATFFGPVKEAA